MSTTDLYGNTIYEPIKGRQMDLFHLPLDIRPSEPERVGSRSATNPENTLPMFPAVVSQTIRPAPQGVDRFALGLAEPGETVHCNGVVLVFVGDFATRKAATATAEAIGVAAKVKGYLNGKRRRGWVVWTASK